MALLWVKSAWPMDLRWKKRDLPLQTLKDRVIVQ